MTELIEIQVTFPDETSARVVAEQLLQQRLAACVQFTAPIKSFYEWEGKREESTEYLALIKARRAHFANIAELITSLHPYTCPQILALPILDGNAPYLQWAREATSEK